MVWLDRLLWVLGQGCAGQGWSDLCKLSIQHATTVLTQSLASGLTLLQPNFWTFYTWITCLLNHKQEIEYEWPYFMNDTCSLMTNVGT